MRDYFISFWSLLDPIYFYCTRLTYLSSKKDNIFRVRLTKYKGSKIILSDGTQINKNDTLLKIHLHNVRLLKDLKSIKSEIKKARLIFNYVKSSLPEMEVYIRNHSYSSQIKGIIGITTLNKGCERLGFEVFDISHPIYRWFKQIAFLPIGILACKDSSVWYVLNEHKPSYIFMSTNKLSDLYRK